MIIALDVKKGKQYGVLFPIDIKTKMTTKLNPDELHDEKKIGEGGFGIVYKGTFRGNSVAIKKMKETRQTKA